jgi:hypothetical protein
MANTTTMGDMCLLQSCALVRLGTTRFYNLDPYFEMIFYLWFSHHVLIFHRNLVLRCIYGKSTPFCNIL